MTSQRMTEEVIDNSVQRPLTLLFRPAYLRRTYNLSWCVVSRTEKFHIVVISVVGALVGFWGFVTHNAMYVAGGVPLALTGALGYRVVRLERLVEELRAQRSETR